MSEQLLPLAAAAGAVLLAICCMPVLCIAKAVLEVGTWALRLALLGLLAGGAYLYFRPGELPAGVASAIESVPGLMSVLPDRASPAFALCAACWLVAALVPFLAGLEVARRVAGRRVADRALYTANPVAEAVVEEPAPVAVPVLRPIDRRTASATITSVWSRGRARAR